jgi:single-stranded DNA-binding protein
MELMGVKGRIQSRIVEEGEKKENTIEIIAEKVTFLSSKKHEEAE